MYEFVLVVLYFTIVGLFAVSMFCLSRWGGRLQTYLFFNCVAHLVYNCAYLLMMHAKDQQTYVTALKIGYLGRVWVGLAMTLFVAELCGKQIPRFLKIIAGVFDMFVYFFILHLESTKLYYKKMEFVINGDFPTLPHSGGAIYYCFTLLNLFYAYVCMHLIIAAFVREKNKTAKKRTLTVMIALIAMCLSYIIYFFKLIPLARIFDTMIIGYAICTALMLIAIIKYKMLDATTAAKNYAVDELSEGIIVVDADDQVSYYNKPALRMFPQLAVTDKTGVATHRMLDDFEAAIRSGEPIRLDGRIYTPRANPLMENGSRIGTLYSLSDDSEHYRYTEELREQKRIADQANRAKSRFLANMSHEIRTPINAVLGFNEMIERECNKVAAADEPKSPAVKEALGNIETYSDSIGGAGNNLLSIINSILDLSKIEAGKMDLSEDTYNLKTLLRDVTGMIRFRAEEKGLAFVTDVAETLPLELYGDMVRIRQVMINILTNSVKYTDKGTVWLTVGAKETGPYEKEQMLTLSFTIKDTGIGIRKEDMQKLFGSFERLELERNSTIEGTGLGLAISRQLVSMMGGKIEAESEYGKGSIFTIDLPQKVVDCEPIGNFSAKVESVGKNEPYHASFTAPDAKVLVVDDTKLNLKLVKALLRDTKLAIDTADSGSQALELCAQNAYDLILMDQRMPNMDGTETMKQIRAQENGCNQKTPVICMTADAIIGSRERYLAEGFDDYLSKPIKVNELEQTLREHLNYVNHTEAPASEPS